MTICQHHYTGGCSGGCLSTGTILNYRQKGGCINMNVLFSCITNIKTYDGVDLSTGVDFSTDFRNFVFMVIFAKFSHSRPEQWLLLPLTIRSTNCCQGRTNELSKSGSCLPRWWSVVDGGAWPKFWLWIFYRIIPHYHWLLVVQQISIYQHSVINYLGIHTKKPSTIP